MSDLLKSMVRMNNAHFDSRSPEEFIELLNSNDACPTEIRNWIGSRTNDLETQMRYLAYQFHFFSSASKWEAAPTDRSKKPKTGSRENHSKRVANLARKLANALEEEIRPPYEPVLAYFDDGHANRIINDLKPTFANMLQSEIEENNLPSAKVLASHFGVPSQQDFPSILRRLAEFSENAARDKKPDRSLDGDGAEKRIFARELNRYFLRHFGVSKDEIIAACVDLKFSDDQEESTSADLIRGWLRKK